MLYLVSTTAEVGAVVCRLPSLPRLPALLPLVSCNAAGITGSSLLSSPETPCFLLGPRVIGGGGAWLLLAANERTGMVPERANDVFYAMPYRFCCPRAMGRRKTVRAAITVRNSAPHYPPDTLNTHQTQHSGFWLLCVAQQTLSHVRPFSREWPRREVQHTSSWIGLEYNVQHVVADAVPPVTTLLFAHPTRMDRRRRENSPGCAACLLQYV